MLVPNVLLISFWKTTAGRACTDAAAPNAYNNFLERNQVMCYWMWSMQMNLGCKLSLFIIPTVFLSITYHYPITNNPISLCWCLKSSKCTFCNPTMTTQTNNRTVISCINQVWSALTPSFVHAWRAISGAWAKLSSFDHSDSRWKCAAFGLKPTQRIILMPFMSFYMLDKDLE